MTPDHLDRHGTMENYAAIKERLVAQADHAVICLDDDISIAIAERLRKTGKPVTFISITNPTIPDGIVLEGTRLMRRARRPLVADRRSRRHRLSARPP